MVNSSIQVDINITRSPYPIELVVLADQQSQSFNVAHIFRDRLGRFIFVRTGMYPQYSNYEDLMLEKAIDYLDGFSSNGNCNRYIVLSKTTLYLPVGNFDKLELLAKLKAAIAEEFNA